MAVLVEAISVIVRRDAIEQKCQGGWIRFQGMVPNDTLCADDEIARVGFMSPSDVETFVLALEEAGLTFIEDRQAVDFAVVDQQRGPTISVEWLEFAHLSIGETGDKVAACWLFDGQRIAHGLHTPSQSMSLATPRGWKYEGSLSANFNFVDNERMKKDLKFLRNEDGVDVYLDLVTGKEVFAGRTS